MVGTIKIMIKSHICEREKMLVTKVYDYNNLKQILKKLLKKIFCGSNLFVTKFSLWIQFISGLDMIKRLCVAGAFLQEPPSLID